MARSRRRTPIISITTTVSEKQDKQHANRSCRAALRGALKLDAEGVHKLETLVRLSQRMEGLIESLLQLSRVGSTELAVETIPLDLLLGEVTELLQPRLEQTNTRIQVTGPLPVVRGDRVRLQEVFNNLLTNAMKYNDRPEKTIRVGLAAAEAAPALAPVGRHVLVGQRVQLHRGGRAQRLLGRQRRAERRQLRHALGHVPLDDPRRQHRQDARAVVRVGRSQFEVEQRAVLVADCEELHTFDQFAAIDTAYPGGRGRAERTAVGHHRRGQHLVATGKSPVELETLAQPPP